MVTGIGAPFSSFCVCALNALQNSMMLRPRWPKAGPIGGDGLAAPAGTCSFTYPVIFFAMLYSCQWCGILTAGDRLTSHVVHSLFPGRRAALCAAPHPKNASYSFST